MEIHHSEHFSSCCLHLLYLNAKSRPVKFLPCSIVRYFEINHPIYFCMIALHSYVKFIVSADTFFSLLAVFEYFMIMLILDSLIK